MPSSTPDEAGIVAGLSISIDLGRIDGRTDLVKIVLTQPAGLGLEITKVTNRI